MKRRWKKFLAGVLSAALALNLAAPLALADSVGCTVVGEELTGNVNSVSSGTKITGQVSYLDNTLTFISNEVHLDTIATGIEDTTPLVTAADGNNELRLVANGKVIGNTKGNGFERPKEIAGGEYSLMNLKWQNPSTGILGGDMGTTITAGTTMKLDGFKTGINGGNVQIDGTVTIKTTTRSGSPVECGIANFTTMNHGSELEIHAQQYIGEQGHLTYNGGHLLLNVTTIGMDFGLRELGIGEDVSRFWYRTDDDAGYTEIDTSVQEKLDSFFEVKETNHAYLELTDVNPDQPESENYDLWVAGTQVTKSNQSNVLGDGTVSYDPATHTLTLNNAHLTLGDHAEEGVSSCIDSDLTDDMLTITGTATLSNAVGIMTVGPLTLDGATLTLTGESGDGVEDAIRAGSQCDKDITIRNSKVTIADSNAEGDFFHYGIRCGKLTVADSTLNVKAGGSAIVADELVASGAGTVITAETDASEEQEYYALELDELTLKDGLALVESKMNESKTAKIARPEQAPTDFKAYWVVRPGDDPVATMQIPGPITGSEEEARLFEGWFLEDGTRLEDSPYYMGPGANHVGKLDRDVTFYGHWRTAESGEGSPDGGDGFGTLLAVGAVVGVAGVVAYQVGTELILDQLLPAGVAVPHTRAELAMLLWNTAGRPAPATLPAFADVADPELAQAAQWAIEQGYLKARADGSFKPDKGVAKWRVIRGYRAVTEP